MTLQNVYSSLKTNFQNGNPGNIKTVNNESKSEKIMNLIAHAGPNFKLNILSLITVSSKRQ